MRIARVMGWTEAEAHAASLEYVLEIAADMALEHESMKATTPGTPGQVRKFVSKKG